MTAEECPLGLWRRFPTSEKITSMMSSGLSREWLHRDEMFEGWVCLPDKRGLIKGMFRINPDQSLIYSWLSLTPRASPLLFFNELYLIVKLYCVTVSNIEFDGEASFIHHHITLSGYPFRQPDDFHSSHTRLRSGTLPSCAFLHTTRQCWKGLGRQMAVMQHLAQLNSKEEENAAGWTCMNICYYFREEAMEEAVAMCLLSDKLELDPLLRLRGAPLFRICPVLSSSSAKSCDCFALSSCFWEEGCKLLRDAFICNAHFPENHSLLSSTRNPVQESFLNVQP